MNRTTACIPSAAPTVHRWEGEAFVWLLEFWPTTAVDLPRHRYGVDMQKGGRNGYGPEAQRQETD